MNTRLMKVCSSSAVQLRSVGIGNHASTTALPAWVKASSIEPQKPQAQVKRPDWMVASFLEMVGGVVQAEKSQVIQWEAATTPD